MSEQNFTAAVIAGAVATLLGAAAYGIVVSVWDFAYGFAAAGIGIVIGLPMGFLGRGISAKFSILATLYTIAGCCLGKFFRVVMDLSQSFAVSPMDVLRDNPMGMIIERAMANLSFIEFVYWLVAVVCAVFLARRPLSRSDRLAIGLYQLKG